MSKRKLEDIEKKGYSIIFFCNKEKTPEVFYIPNHTIDNIDRLLLVHLNETTMIGIGSLRFTELEDMLYGSNREIKRYIQRQSNTTCLDAPSRVGMVDIRSNNTSMIEGLQNRNRIEDKTRIEDRNQIKDRNQIGDRNQSGDRNQIKNEIQPMDRPQPKQDIHKTLIPRGKTSSKHDPSARFTRPKTRERNPSVKNQIYKNEPVFHKNKLQKTKEKTLNVSSIRILKSTIESIQNDTVDSPHMENPMWKSNGKWKNFKRYANQNFDGRVTGVYTISCFNTSRVYILSYGFDLVLFLLLEHIWDRCKPDIIEPYH